MRKSEIFHQNSRKTLSRNTNKINKKREPECSLNIVYYNADFFRLRCRGIQRPLSSQSRILPHPIIYSVYYSVIMNFQNFVNQNKALKTPFLCHRFDFAVGASSRSANRANRCRYAA